MKAINHLSIVVVTFAMLFLNIDTIHAQRHMNRYCMREHNPQGMGRQQNKPMGRQRIEEQRIAYITNELNLTPEEAKAFWPLYNEYTAKSDEIRSSCKNRNNANDFCIDSLTNAEAGALLKEELDQMQKLLDLRKEYVKKFQSVIPTIKVVKLYNSDKGFQRVMLNKLRNNADPNKSVKPNKK